MMKKPWGLIGMGVATLTLFACSEQLASEQRLVIIQNGESVGYIHAEREGTTSTVEYYVDSNGRGPKTTSSLELSKRGIPLSIDVQGTSLMGSDVRETYSVQGDLAKWTSQADAGEAEIAEPTLYAVNDGSPWFAYLNTKALLADSDHKMPLLPSGHLTLSQVKKKAMSEGFVSTDFTLYRLSGIDISPTYIAIDGQGDFFAQSGGSSVIIKERYEVLAPQFAEMMRGIVIDEAEAMAADLKHDFDSGFIIQNVHIFDPLAGKLSEASTVKVVGERIVDIVPFTSEELVEGDATVFDGEGGVLLSGLYDMHHHISLKSGFFYLAAGVTSVRDLGNDNTFLADYMEKLDEGKFIGPRITPAGFIEGRSPYSARHGIIVATEEEAIAAVDWYADRGFEWIKTYNSMKPEWSQAVAAHAHAKGLRIVGHVPAFSTPDRQILAGYDEITHLNQFMLGWLLTPEEDTRTPLRLTAMQRASELDLLNPKVRTTIDLMKENNVGLDTTAVILELLMLSRAGEVPDFAKDFFDHMPVGYQRYRKRSFVTIDNEERDAAYREAFHRLLQTIKLAYDEGIQLLPGTDDSVGFTMQREVELYVMAGLSEADALRIATYETADYLGQGKDLGSIEVGKYADFMLLAGNPLENIKAIKAPRMVVKNGSVYYPSEIYGAFSIEPFADDPVVLSKGASE